MQKTVQFNVNREIEIKQETIGGFLLDITALQSDGATVAAINDLNNIGLDVIVERQGQKGKYQIQGYLEDILSALYSQTVTYELNKKQFENGYKIFINFNGSLQLRQGDVLRIKLNARENAFTLLDTSKSSINVETVPSFRGNTALPVVRTKPVGAGEINIDEELGNNVAKLVLLTDYANAYDVSTKSKIVNADIEASGFSKTVSNALLEMENIHYLDMNPESDVRHMVVYWGAPLHSVHFRAKLDIPAEADAKILTVHLETL